MASTAELRFCWWNMQDFAHFDPNRNAIKRWPVSIDMHVEKRRRVVTAFDAMFGHDDPEVIGLCEITRPAAEELQRQRFPDHELVLTELADPTSFQVVLLIRRGRNLSRREAWFANDVTEETRPMGVVQYYTRKAAILFVACHWPAFDEPSSQEMRRRCADRLRGGIHEFLFPPSRATTPRSVTVLGDLNTEPHDELFSQTLYASRDRDHARRTVHYTDDAVSRVRLYNCGWRLVGESHPHGMTEPVIRRVGTYYQAKSHTWRTYDQVLVTGRLLSEQPPFVDESALLVRTDAGNLMENKPAKFRYENGVGYGLSDHYPLSGRIVLD